MPAVFLDVLLVAAEVGILVLLYAVARLLLGRGLRGAKARGGRSARAAEAGSAAANLLLIIIFAALMIGVLAANGYLVFVGQDVSSSTAEIAARLSAHLPEIGIAVALVVGLIGGTAILLRLVRWGLQRLRQRALGWEQLRLNDVSVSGFFDLLSAAVGWCAWFCALSLAARIAGFPSNAQEVLWLATRIAVVCSIALLIIRAVAAILDSLDALVARYSADGSRFLGWYSHAKPLVPLFRRCLELAIWLTAASILMLQVSPFAPFAEYAPRLIGVVGVFFLARAAAELVNILVDRQGAPTTLSAIELQQRATLLPLVKSIGRTLVYFCAFAIALNLLGINPVPLLAGAGILGVVIGFGAQAVINDLVSGFFILSENQFLVGDYIEAGTARGIVEGIQLRTTRIRDPNGQLHIVRNGQLGAVVNYSKTYTFAVVELPLPFDADLEHSRAALSAAAAQVASNNSDILAPTSVDGIEQVTPDRLVVRTTTKVRPGTHGAVARELREAMLVALR